MHEQPNEPVHADVTYEKSETITNPAVIAGIGIVILCLIAYGISLLTFDGFKTRTARDDPKLSALAAKERPKLPQGLDKIPEPRLEVHEGDAVGKQLEKDEKRLNGYGWTDPKKETVHIPIAEAMRLLADPEIAKAKGIRVDPSQGGGK
jgi:hypothetical protein